ncbi:efflux RND transporter permease subunit [Pararhodobacter aggregans]|uniref:efflux RND transporter permease subunit n=1 Tax=Pararhodobacter aggregans TaxID=404875 RepID=UPI000D43B770|nr:efflux RND transporter permease subunit [Pararhodobacter aggregans]PTX03389.1 AcrB/AcrD/AcrF family protein [Pararhodobacter aggregans]
MPRFFILRLAHRHRHRVAGILAIPRQSMPADMEVSLSYNTAPYVGVSITRVIQTLFEAMGMIFLVILLFLQSRATG